jgi:hypothetical protein
MNKPSKKPQIKEKYLFVAFPSVNAPITNVVERQTMDSCHVVLGFRCFDSIDANLAPGIVPSSTTKKKIEISAAFNPTSLDKYTTAIVVKAPTADCTNMVAIKYHLSPFL